MVPFQLNSQLLDEAINKTGFPTEYMFENYWKNTVGTGNYRASFLCHIKSEYLLYILRSL